MARLSKTLACLASKLVHERHQDEAKVEAHQLRKTMERILARGIGEAELLAPLGHEHWQSKIALRMAEAGVPMEAARNQSARSAVAPLRSPTRRFARCLDAGARRPYNGGLLFIIQSTRPHTKAGC
jgi:hypothetical protein